jgi:hypothetical protein
MTRLRRFTYGLALVWGVLTAQSSLAAADTVDLFCQPSGATGGYGLNLSIDMAASTGTVWSPGQTRKDVSASRATITADRVTWGPLVVNAPQYTLDRNSGTLNIASPNQMGGPFAVVVTWSCRKTTPVF